MKNAYGENWEMPEWMVKMAGEIAPATGHTNEETVNDVNRMMNNFYGSTLEILSGEHVDKDPKVPTPKAYLEMYPKLPAEIPARVAKVLEKQFGVSRCVDPQGLINNFSLNMTNRLSYPKNVPTVYADNLLPPSHRILNYPSITATTYGEMWSDFDQTIERLGIKSDFLATVSPSRLNSKEEFKSVREQLFAQYGWYGNHTPFESNKVAVPAFVDMASRGWSMAHLMG